MTERQHDVRRLQLRLKDPCAPRVGHFGRKTPCGHEIDCLLFFWNQTDTRHNRVVHQEHVHKHQRRVHKVGNNQTGLFEGLSERVIGSEYLAKTVTHDPYIVEHASVDVTRALVQH